MSAMLMVVAASASVMRSRKSPPELLRVVLNETRGMRTPISAVHRPRAPFLLGVRDGYQAESSADHLER